MKKSEFMLHAAMFDQRLLGKTCTIIDCDFVVCMSDLCSKYPLIGLHKIQTKEIKCRQFSPSPCLFAQPEAVSKHSVSLWIGYSGIENVQRRATKLIPILSGLSYEERLKKLKLPTLKYRRLRGDMIEVFKILMGI